MILVPVGMGFFVILGLISAGRAVGFLCILMAMMALAPFVESLMDTLPLWILIAIGVFFSFSIIHAVASLLLGKGVSDNFLGLLVFELFMAPFRLLRWMLQILFRGGRA